MMDHVSYAVHGYYDNVIDAEWSGGSENCVEPAPYCQWSEPVSPA